MKRLFIVALLLVVLPLAGCTKLSNEYFENNTLNHVDDAMDLFEGYTNHMMEYYIENYPIISEMFDIKTADSYIPFTGSLDSIQRHELLNYHLTDNRGYLVNNHMTTVLEQIAYIYSFGISECPNAKEDKVCTSDELPGTSIRVLMEDKEVIVEYTKIVDTEYYTQYKATYFYHFRYEEELLVLDFSYEETSIDTDEAYLSMYLYYKENTVEQSKYRTHYESDNSYYKEVEINFNLLSMDYTKKVETHESASISYYNNENNEKFSIEVENGDYRNFAYTIYNGTKKIVSLINDKTLYAVNFSEVAGWDFLELTSGENEYNIYYNNIQIEDLTVFLNTYSGEYVFQNFKTETTFDDDLLSLSKFGLSLPYDTQYFEDKENYFMDNIDKIIHEANIEPIGVDIMIPY